MAIMDPMGQANPPLPGAYALICYTKIITIDGNKDAVYVYGIQTDIQTYL